VTTVTARDLMAHLLAQYDGVYLLWSGRHKAWWAPAGFGYTTDRARAGRFSFLEAVHNVASSAYQGDPELVTRMVWTES